MPENSAAFWRQGFETVCFDSSILEQALAAMNVSIHMAREICGLGVI
jgi:hypothetical protein